MKSTGMPNGLSAPPKGASVSVSLGPMELAAHAAISARSSPLLVPSVGTIAIDNSARQERGDDHGKNWIALISMINSRV